MSEHSGTKPDAPNAIREQEKAVDYAKAVKQKHGDRLKSFSNVVGVGVGYEVVAGKRTNRMRLSYRETSRGFRGVACR